MTLGDISPAAGQFVAKWLNRGGTDSSAEATPTHILQRLRDAGFSGCGEYLELESGFFFSHSPFPRLDEILVAVATGVQMPQGAPGLVLERGRSGVHDYYDVGMFIGPVPKSGERISVG